MSSPLKQLHERLIGKQSVAFRVTATSKGIHITVITQVIVKKYLLSKIPTYKHLIKK